MDLQKLNKQIMWRILSHILIIYGGVLFIMTIHYDGVEFTEDASFINYILRSVFGIVPAIPFLLLGKFCFVKSGELTKFKTPLEKRLEWKRYESGLTWFVNGMVMSVAGHIMLPIAKGLWWCIKVLFKIFVAIFG